MSPPSKRTKIARHAAQAQKLKFYANETGHTALSSDIDDNEEPEHHGPAKYIDLHEQEFREATEYE
jgi:hypothetical protein